MTGLVDESEEPRGLQGQRYATRVIVLRKSPQKPSGGVYPSRRPDFILFNPPNEGVLIFAADDGGGVIPTRRPHFHFVYSPQ
jgi:hypothetical protein